MEAIYFTVKFTFGLTSISALVKEPANRMDRDALSIYLIDSAVFRIAQDTKIDITKFVSDVYKEANISL